MRIFLIALLAAISYAQTGVNKVIYGTDNRQDVYEREAADADDMWVKIAKESIVALFKSSDLGTANSDGEFTLPSTTLETNQAMCVGERFRDQLAPAQCSGTLVDSTHVVTAGHCVDSVPCDSMKLVFNFYVTGHDSTTGFSYQTITEHDVYSCSKYVRETNNLRDYAYIELDREVLSSSGHVGVQNMEIGEDVRLSPGDEVVVIGFGSGLPMKIDTGATVFANDAGSNTQPLSPDFSFKASLDTFGGNSGSGVFKSDGTLIGIHFIGNQDYTQEDDGNGNMCQRNHVMPNGSPGEESQNYLYLAMNDICMQDSDCESTEYCSNLAGGIGQCRPSTSNIENFPMCTSDHGADEGKPVQCCKYDNDCQLQDDLYCCSGKPYCTTDPETAFSEGLDTCPGYTTGQTLELSSRNANSCIHITIPDDGSVSMSLYRYDLQSLGITFTEGCRSQYDQECTDSDLSTQVADLQTTLEGYGLTPTIASHCCDSCGVLQCPNDGGPATCCDADTSCDDGDDDWCCGANGDEFYCSNDGQEYAESRGGILCPNPLIDCGQCGADVVAANLCYCFDAGEDCDDDLQPASCDDSCGEQMMAACAATTATPTEDGDSSSASIFISIAFFSAFFAF